jgi:hypothetical protein
MILAPRDENPCTCGLDIIAAETLGPPRRTLRPAWRRQPYRRRHRDGPNGHNFSNILPGVVCRSRRTARRESDGRDSSRFPVTIQTAPPQVAPSFPLGRAAPCRPRYDWPGNRRDLADLEMALLPLQDRRIHGQGDGAVDCFRGALIPYRKLKPITVHGVTRNAHARHAWAARLALVGASMVVTRLMGRPRPAGLKAVAGGRVALAARAL